MLGKLGVRMENGSPLRQVSMGARVMSAKMVLRKLPPVLKGVV
jgi:hypothetical protein